MLDLFELSKLFMIEHINSLELDDLSVSERSYRIEHSMRVSKYAKMLAKKDNYSVEVCQIAGILHDVGKFECDDNKDHGRVSAAIAREYLESLDIDKKLVDDICYCIATHCDGDAGYEYEHIIEADIVRDADRIDRFGVYRIIQSLHYSDFDLMTLKQKIKLCDDKVKEIEKYLSTNFATCTAKMLYEEAANRQIEYFQSLKKELEFTIDDKI